MRQGISSVKMNPIYKQRIQLAVEFIEANLEKNLTLELLAKQCYFSPFHFHRIFSAAMNETLNNYVARKRLEKAINLLVFKRDKSITEIALDCGFSSSANFAKAVKLYFGYTPTDIRSPSNQEIHNMGRIFEKYGKSFNPNALYASTPCVAAEHKIVVKQLQSKRLVKLSSINGYEQSSLYRTWDALCSWVAQQGVPIKDQYRLAWCYDNPAVTPADKCKYEASIAIDDSIDINTNFEKATFPSGDYAIVYAKGSSEQISMAQTYLFSHWLPNSEFEPDNLPMLEHYLNDARVDGYIEMEILVKLKRL